jgi:hypothetical protein
VLPGGIASTDGSFRGTPAESIVRSEYGGDKAPPPAAQIDGNPSEWSPADILHVTPASGGLEISGRQEGNSLYLLLKFQRSWPVNNWIRVQFGASPTSSAGELLQVNYALGRFWGYLCGEPRCSAHVGQIDVAGDADRTCLELYVPLRLLDSHAPTRLSISFLDASFSTYLTTPVLQVPATGTP